MAGFVKVGTYEMISDITAVNKKGETPPLLSFVLLVAAISRDYGRLMLQLLPAGSIPCYINKKKREKGESRIPHHYFTR